MVRPKKSVDHVRSKFLQLRLTTGERTLLEAAAKVAGQSLTVFIRNAAHDKAALLLKHKR